MAIPLAPWSRILHEKLVVVLLYKIVLPFTGPRCSLLVHNSSSLGPILKADEYSPHLHILLYLDPVSDPF
jgi:hypothetical protein